MKKLILLFILLNSIQARAQITGDSIVCAGYLYNYTATIPGALTYTWTLPSGWFGLSGQGTSFISATCNVTVGNICVEGFDSNMNSVGTECITTQWGNGGAQGWDIWPGAFYYCVGQSRDITFQILPNGSGGGACPAGCGNGTQSPNLIYGLYDSSLPYPQFIGEIDGSTFSMPPLVTTYYAYYVDITLGYDFPDAVIISGGCGTATINNTVQVNEVTPWPPQFTQVPDPACVGDTVLFTNIESFVTNISWTPLGGLTLLNNPTSEQALVVITSGAAQLLYSGTDQQHYCLTSGIAVPNFGICIPPLAGFTASDQQICPGTCTDFSNQSVSAQSYLWSFPGGNPASSIDVNPSNICYAAPGSFDVSLIAFNSSGSDTLLMPGYIQVYPYPPPQSITQAGDTLFSNPGFDSYVWYHNGNLIPGATTYFYVAQLDGDYNLISTDSNGCEVEAVILNVLTGISALNKNNTDLTLWPNPAESFILLKLLQGAGNICIYNVIGEKIFSEKYAGKLYEIRIDIDGFSPGTYFIEMTSGQTISRTKFIIY